MQTLKHAYPYNTNVMPNPVDTRSEPLLRSGGGKQGKQGKRGSRCKGGKKLKYKNYSGRQIGCRSRSSMMTRTRTRSRSRRQSGGDVINNLPMDASMLVQSATKVGGDLWHGLQGTPSVNPSPFPFMDQGIKDSTTPPPLQPLSQSGGLRRKRRQHNQRKSQRSKKYKKAASNSNSKRYRRRHSSKVQSGGDLFSYLPFDMSTTARSALTGIGNAFNGTKGLPGSVSPLPYNDHDLQKPELKASDHLPDLEKYYRNANLSIPSL